MKFILRDTFNDVVISTHRTLDAAIRAERKFARAVRRANGQNSYLPTEVTWEGVDVTENEYVDAMIRAGL